MGSAGIAEGRKRACYKSCVRPRRAPSTPAPVEVQAMNRRYLRSHLSDQAVLRSLRTNNEQELASTADLLADLAEVDARRLYRPAGYSSMFTYCVDVLRRSEVSAYKRIRAARAARRFPVIFDMVAEGRLHLSGVVMLAPYLTEPNAQELLAAATHQTAKAIERLLAERFPRPDVPTLVQALMPATPAAELTLKSVGGDTPVRSGDVELTLKSVEAAPAPTAPVDRPTVKPLAPQRFALQVTIDEETHDALRYAQDLLSHELQAGDVDAVLKMALQALIPELENRRFAAADRPRAAKASKSLRHIPARVRREVWKRDGGQCTFVSEDGHRCTERKFVQFDHVIEVARGGEATVEGIQLRCWAHNQYTAERTFGAEFMRHKRIAATEARDAAKPYGVAAAGSPAGRAEAG